jgi:hypothetical protein
VAFYHSWSCDVLISQIPKQDCHKVVVAMFCVKLFLRDELACNVWGRCRRIVVGMFPDELHQTLVFFRFVYRRGHDCRAFVFGNLFLVVIKERKEFES